MKRCIALLLVIAAVTVADDAAELMKKARTLEKRAGKLLDAGQKEKALDLILEAAELRQRARDGKPAAKDVVKEAPVKRAKAGGMVPTRPKMREAPVASRKIDGARLREINIGLKQFDEAVAKGDMARASKVAKGVRHGLQRWSRELARREAAMRGRNRGGVEARIAKLERELVEIRRMLDPR